MGRYVLNKSDYDSLKRKDFSSMNAWVCSFYKEAFREGEASVKATDSEAIIKEIGKVKGIGQKRIKAIREAIERCGK